MIWKDCLDGFLIDARSRRLSENTLIDYERTFRRFGEFIGVETEIDDVTPEDVRKFFAKYPHLSAKSLLNFHAGLSSLWTFLEKEGVAKVQIMRQVTRPVADKVEIEPFSEQQIKLLLSSLSKTTKYSRSHNLQPSNHSLPYQRRNKAIIYLSLDTGVRVSELAALKLADVDIKELRIHVKQGKGRKGRLIPFSSDTAKSIWQYLQERTRKSEEDFLFTDKRERGLNRDKIGKMMARLGERAGVPNTHPHRFRHTFAIMYLRNGGNVFALQKILGHSNLETVKRYLAIVQTDIDNAHKRFSPISNMNL